MSYGSIEFVCKYGSRVWMLILWWSRSSICRLLAEVVEMIGHAGRPNKDNRQFCYIVTSLSKVFWKICSHSFASWKSFRPCLTCVCAEVVAKQSQVNKKQLMTWSYFYRRLTKIKTTTIIGNYKWGAIGFLWVSWKHFVWSWRVKMHWNFERRYRISPLNLGMISSYRTFNTRLLNCMLLPRNANTKLRPMLQILSFQWIWKITNTPWRR